MKLINPSFEIYEQGPGLEGIYEQIELAGRTCYKSKRPEGQTAKDFVDRMIASQHYAMLEHGTVYLIERWKEGMEIKPKYDNNPYSKVKVVNFYGETWKYITTNLRVLMENDWLDDLQYIREPTEYHERRVTVRFTTDRGVSHEFVRHRVFSFAQESTRYCNYSKDKFGNELTFIIPSWTNIEEGSIAVDSFGCPVKPNEETCDFLSGLGSAERNYFRLINKGWKPQQARQVLSNALKTELVMTGFVSDWQHFFDLRARGITGAPHPDAKALAEPLMREFYKRGLI